MRMEFSFFRAKSQVVLELLKLFCPPRPAQARIQVAPAGRQ
jgi:hypothetical protein